MGPVLEVIGVLILLYFNGLFIQKSRKEYGSLKKAFVDIAAARASMSDEEFRKADADDALRTFPLAQFLCRTYRNSLIGVAITLIGVVVSVVGIIHFN
jgi:hypothetical protein